MKKSNVFILLLLMLPLCGIVNADDAEDLADDFQSESEFQTNETIQFANGMRLTVQSQHKIDSSLLVYGIKDDMVDNMESVLSVIDQNVTKHSNDKEITLHLYYYRNAITDTNNNTTSSFPIDNIIVLKKYNHSSTRTWRSPLNDCEASTFYFDMIAGTCELQEWTGSRWSTYQRGSGGRMYDRCSYTDVRIRPRGYRIRPLPVGARVRGNIVVIYYNAYSSAHGDDRTFLDTDEILDGNTGNPGLADSLGIRRISKNVASNRGIGAGPIVFGGWPCHAADIFVSVKRGRVEIYTCVGSGCSNGDWRLRAVRTRRDAPFLKVYRGRYKQRGFKLVGSGASVSFAAAYYTPYESDLVVKQPDGHEK